jgi:hypothetical protein
MALADDLAGCVVDDHAADGTAFLVVGFLREQGADTHEILVRQFPEKLRSHQLRQVLGGDIRDCVERRVAYGGVFGDKEIGHGKSFMIIKALLQGYPRR